MDNIICPACGEETYIYQLGVIGTWQWYKCDCCDSRHWRNKGGINQLQKNIIARAKLYAQIEKDQKK